MAFFNVSVDDSSPLISYSLDWDDTPDGDDILAQYQSHSLHSSSTKNATATFIFNGTGVWFYGGKRASYGTFSFAVDGNVIAGGVASASASMAQQLLAGMDGLSMGEHEAVLMNTGTGTVDIDSVLFETQTGSANGTVSYSIIEDGASNITYSGSDWLYSSDPIFTNGGTHYTGVDGASTSVTFAGDAVAIYGGASYDHGNYTVSLDGVQQQFSGGSNGQVRLYHPQTLLYFATNLGNGTHNVTITNSVVGNATFLDVDQIGVYISPGYSSDNNTVTTVTPLVNYHVNQADAANASAAGTAASIPPHGLSKVVIAAIVAISVFVLLLILGLVIFLVKRSKKVKKANKKMLPSPVLPIQDDPEKGFPRNESSGDRALPPQKSDDGDYAPSGNFVAFPAEPDLARKLSTRTAASSWSQSSRDSTETLKGPSSPKMDMPMPYSPADPILPPITPLSINYNHSPTHLPMPPPPVIPMPEHLQGHARSGSVSSDSSSESRRSTVYGEDDEDFSSYYRDSTVYDQHPTHQTSGTPTRPHRPPGLSLHEFSTVRL